MRNRVSFKLTQSRTDPYGDTVDNGGENLKARPHMPWYSLNVMKDEDLCAICQLIRHVGPGGEAAPAYLQPDKELGLQDTLYPTAPYQ